MNLCSPTISSEIRHHVWKIPVHAQSLRADMDLVMVIDKRETTTSTGKFYASDNSWQKIIMGRHWAKSLEDLKPQFRVFKVGRKNVIVANRAVFKWLSKVITWLRLLRLVIGLKDSRQFFSQWEAKPKPIAPCTGNFFRASGKLQVISRNSDWFMALFASVVIGRSSYFGFGFTTVIWKPL